MRLPPSVPELLSARNVLPIQPHYDDNDIAAGGTLAALAERGARIVTVTDDLAGVLGATLSDAEATERLRLGYADAGPWDAFALRRDLARLMVDAGRLHLFDEAGRALGSGEDSARARAFAALLSRAG